MVFRQEMNADKEDRTTTSPCATQDRYPLPKRTVLVEVRRGHPAKAFDAVLVQELHEVIQKAKRMADEIQKASDLWDLEHHLTNAVKRLTANTTLATRELRMCCGDSCMKSTR